MLIRRRKRRLRFQRMTVARGATKSRRGQSRRQRSRLQIVRAPRRPHAVSSVDFFDGGSRGAALASYAAFPTHPHFSYQTIIARRVRQDKISETLSAASRFDTLFLQITVCVNTNWKVRGMTSGWPLRCALIPTAHRRAEPQSETHPVPECRSRTSCSDASATSRLFSQEPMQPVKRRIR